MKFSKEFSAFSLILMTAIAVGLFFVFFQDSLNPKTELTSSLSKINFTNRNHDTNNISTNNEEINEPKKLVSPPDIIKAIYLTSWSASREDRIDYVVSIAETTEINAVVIDIKDFSGYIAYDMNLAETEKYYSASNRITDIDLLIEKLHKQRIYVIARITVFQDPVLARRRPDLAVHSQSKLSLSDSSQLSSSSLWLDNIGLAWIDPAAKEYWDYMVAISKDALARGFDELNFDYIRFPSDGNLQDMSFPFWNGVTPRHEIIRDFFKHLRQEVPEAKLSIDLFGLSTISSKDLGIGQIIEDAFEYFDYICPMVYPSHYADGFLGYQNPAEYPYGVVRYSMENALRRLMIYRQLKETDEKKIDIDPVRDSQLRPWLQDFNLGAIYNPEAVRSEIKAVSDATGDNFKGFMLWNSRNVYTIGALQPAALE